MLHPPEQIAATIRLAFAKDLRLLREAAASRQARLSLADQMVEIFAEATRLGLAGQGWAVEQYRMAQRRESKGSAQSTVK